jgi:hypothetical protein
LKVSVDSKKRVVSSSRVVHDARCPKGFKELFSTDQVSVTGPAGAPGETGAQGAQGPQGPRGPSTQIAIIQKSCGSEPICSCDAGGAVTSAGVDCGTDAILASTPDTSSSWVATCANSAVASVTLLCSRESCDSDVDCTGVSQCDTNGYCTCDAEYPGPRCEGIRLVGGANERSGRVEVFHGGVWGTVCDDNFLTTSATVVCRQLGYSSGTMYTAAAGSGPIFMDQVACAGSEARLQDCPFNGWGITDCSHSEDIGVTCTP